MELTDIGAFTGAGRLVVRYDEQVVLDLDNEFLHEGIPQRQLTARSLPVSHPGRQTAWMRTAHPDLDLEATLLNLLAHPNIASKAARHPHLRP